MSPLTQPPFGPSPRSPVQSHLVRGTPTSLQPVTSSQLPLSRHGALPLAHITPGTAESQSQRIFRLESIGLRGALTQHPQPHSTAPPSSAAPQRSALLQLHQPHAPRMPMVPPGSPTVNSPRARIAGPMPVPAHPSIAGAPCYRWPRRAGRCCAAHSVRRGFQSARRSPRPPALPSCG